MEMSEPRGDFGNVESRILFLKFLSFLLGQQVEQITAWTQLVYVMQLVRTLKCGIQLNDEGTIPLPSFNANVSFPNRAGDTILKSGSTHLGNMCMLYTFQ